MSITAECKSVARTLISFALCVQMRCVCVETSMEGRIQRTGLKCCGLPSFYGLWNVRTGLCVCVCVCMLCLVELVAAGWHSSSTISGRRAFVHDGSPRINCFSVYVLDSREGHVGNEAAERCAWGWVNVDRQCVAAFARLVCLANKGK